MMAHNLTTASTLMCPHGGTVIITPSGERAQATGAVMVTASDTFIIAGCPYQLPTVPPTPSPCTTVIWVSPQMRVKIGGNPGLDESSVGLCIGSGPQGSVIVQSTQSSVQGQ
jgi:hypothetical protein